MTMVLKEWPVLDKGYVSLVGVMGNDHTVINAARVSFARQADDDFSERDIKLVKYLADHKHVSPFYHPQLQFKVKAPISVQRQWFKHKIGTAENSESTRYVEVSDEYYIPTKFRHQSASNKQGSEGLVDEQGLARFLYIDTCRRAYDNYHNLLGLGVARETARDVLPLCTYVSWIWTASLYAVIHFLHLRLDPHAQFEIREYAQAIRELTLPYFPHSFSAFQI